MKRMFLRQMLAAIAFAAAASASANLVTNGSFETPVVANNSFATYDPGITFDSWTVIPGANVAVIDAGFTCCVSFVGVAHQGNQFLDLTGSHDSGVASGIAQFLPTIVGNLYNASFWVGNSTAAGAVSSTVEVFIGGLSHGLFANALPGAAASWSMHQTLFTATSTSTELRFVGRDLSGDDFTGLDSVTVTAAIPEPSTYALMLAGLGLVALVAHRRSRRTR